MFISPNYFLNRPSIVKSLRMLHATVTMLAAPLIGPSAQGPAQSGPVAPQKRAEAGVTVLTHDRFAFGRAAQLMVATAPESEFGGVHGDPAFDLTRVTSVALLADGGLSAFSDDQRLLVFGPDGAARRTIGRRGQGPGEFAGARYLLSLTGDTLLVPDLPNARMNWLLPAKGVVRTESLKDRLPPLVQRPAGVLSGGRVVLTSTGLSYPQAHPPSGFFRTQASVLILPPRGPGRVVATIPDVQFKTVPTNFNGSPGVMADYVRYGVKAHVVVWDTLIASVTGETYQIDLRNSVGRVVSRLLVAAPRRAVTPAMKKARIAEEVDQLHQFLSRKEEMRDPVEAERLFRAAPIADSLPACADLFVTPKRTLWVLDAIMPSDTSWTATAFRLDGAIVGRLRGVGRATPVAFGDDRVVLRSSDIDGLVKLEVHRIVPIRQH
jgi:hypothetical protein